MKNSNKNNDANDDIDEISDVGSSFDFVKVISNPKNWTNRHTALLWNTHGQKQGERYCYSNQIVTTNYNNTTTTILGWLAPSYRYYIALVLIIIMRRRTKILGTVLVLTVTTYRTGWNWCGWCLCACVCVRVCGCVPLDAHISRKIDCIIHFLLFSLLWWIVVNTVLTLNILRSILVIVLFNKR